MHRLAASSLIALVTAAGSAAPRDVHAAASSTAPIVVAEFSGRPPAFPDAWKSRNAASEMTRVYSVAHENGASYLHAVADANSVQIGLPVSFHLADYPLLSWRWRVDELPTGADERSAATNDSPAGVYVVFRGALGGMLPRSIKYVWSAREPRGATFSSPRYPSCQIVVLESGGAERRTWKTETVNVVADYRRLFQADPPDPQGIGILTDADDTRSRAVADYDEFRALATTAAGSTAETAAEGAR